MNWQMFKVAIVGLTISICFWGHSAVAWNSPGHIVIALVAYDQMDAASRAKASELLRAHPRYGEHFERAMPRDVSRGSAEEQDRWSFAHAATWPDQVRNSRGGELRGGDARGGVSRADVDRFSRPWWHFINMPLFLSPEDERQVAGELRFNLRREPPNDDDDENMNIIQAIKNSLRIVRDEFKPKEQRAVHLCWLLHLGGDSHQPLHSTALVSARRFRTGDQGGNFLQIEYDWTLHSFWDSQVSTDEEYSTQLRLVEDLANNAELAAAGEKAAASLDPGTWMDEGRELAIKFVYTREVLDKVAAREGHTHLGPLDLSAEYRANAEQVAERRAAESAHRLAKLLDELLQ